MRTAGDLHTKKRRVTTDTGGSTSAEAHDSVESEHSSNTESNSDSESDSIFKTGTAEKTLSQTDIQTVNHNSVP